MQSFRLQRAHYQLKMVEKLAVDYKKKDINEIATWSLPETWNSMEDTIMLWYRETNHSLMPRTNKGKSKKENKRNKNPRMSLDCSDNKTVKLTRNLRRVLERLGDMLLLRIQWKAPDISNVKNLQKWNINDDNNPRYFKKTYTSTIIPIQFVNL